jgi:predicted DNA-binding ribbon-helix-helix protein
MNRLKANEMTRSNSTLICRNVTLGGRRTSLRLERATWSALEEIAEREAISVSEVCARADNDRRSSSFTAGVRVFVLNYFREAADEDGHGRAGHGKLPGDRIQRLRQTGRSARGFGREQGNAA